MDLLGLIAAFFTDPRTIIVFGLILLDVVTGIAAAIKTKTFSADRMADFLATNVMPFVVGYLAFYLLAAGAAAGAVEKAFSPAAAVAVDQVLVTLAGGFSIIALIESIRMNVDRWRGVPPAPETESAPE